MEPLVYSDLSPIALHTSNLLHSHIHANLEPSPSPQNSRATPNGPRPDRSSQDLPPQPRQDPSAKRQSLSTSYKSRYPVVCIVSTLLQPGQPFSFPSLQQAPYPPVNGTPGHHTYYPYYPQNTPRPLYSQHFITPRPSRKPKRTIECTK